MAASPANELTNCAGLRLSDGHLLGAGLRTLYNDAYLPIAGTKHPWALGRAAREVYPEAWDFVGPMFDEVVIAGSGQPTSWPTSYSLLTATTTLKRSTSHFRLARFRMTTATWAAC